MKIELLLDREYAKEYLCYLVDKLLDKYPTCNISHNVLGNIIIKANNIDRKEVVNILEGNWGFMNSAYIREDLRKYYFSNANLLSDARNYYLTQLYEKNTK